MDDAPGPCTASRAWLFSQQLYTIYHQLMVDVLCVLFLTQSACMVQKQNTRNINHKQMNNGVGVSQVTFIVKIFRRMARLQVS